MYLYDTDTLEIVDVNRAAVNQYGYSVVEFRALNVTNLGTGSQPFCLQDIDQYAIKDGNTGICKHRDKTGREFFVEILAAACPHEERNLKLVQAKEIAGRSEEGESGETTHKKRWTPRVAEKELLRTAIEGMPGIFYMIDEEQKIVMWNKNLERSLGYSSEEIRQICALDFYRKEDHDLIASKIDEALEDGETYVEVDLLGKDGRSRHHRITGRVFENGGKKYVVGSGIDITERIQYEKELKQTIHEKKILLQEIHHRVKNNLAVINGLLELQKSRTNHPKLHRALSESQLRIKSMAYIQDELYQSESMSRVEINQIIDKIAQTAQNTLDKEKTITILSDCSPLEMNVNQAVPCALIINELISNAFEHAFPEKRKGVIKLRVRESGEVISVTIKDSGVGLPDEYIKGKVDSLGFTIIHTLINQLNARLEIRNEKGASVTFSFRRKEIKGSSSTLIDL